MRGFVEKHRRRRVYLPLCLLGVGGVEQSAGAASGAGAVGHDQARIVVRLDARVVVHKDHVAILVRLLSPSGRQRVRAGALSNKQDEHEK